MKKLIITFIDDIKSNKKLTAFDEASTKQAIVMRLLSFLGWDIFNVDEVSPDYSVKSEQIDYALKIKNKIKVFISVKKPGEELDDFQKPLIDFSTSEKVDISILTNGSQWWFYLAAVEGDFKQKNFYSLNLLQDEANEISAKLKDFLGKSNISNGKALSLAKSVIETRKQKMANELIPEAWNKLLSEPNRILGGLILEKAEELCGIAPDKEIVEKFLNDHINDWLVVKPVAPEPGSQVVKAVISEDKTTELKKDPPERKLKPKNYTGEEIASFSFNGNTYEVDSWNQMLLTLCDIIVAAHKEDFDKVLWLSGQNRSYFSTMENELRYPEKIKRTNIFVEKQINPNESVNTALSMISAFGYSSKELSVSLKGKQ